MGGMVRLKNGMGFGYGHDCELDKLGNAVAEAENALNAARKQLREAQRNVLQCEADLKTAEDEFNKMAHRVGEIRSWVSVLEVRREAYALWRKVIEIIEQLPPEEAEKFDELVHSTGPHNPWLFGSWSVPQEVLDELYQEHQRLQGTDGGGHHFEAMEEEWGRLFFLEPIIGTDHLHEW